MVALLGHQRTNTANKLYNTPFFLIEKKSLAQKFRELQIYDPSEMNIRYII